MVRVKQIVLFIYFLGLCSCNNTMQQGRSYRYYVGTMKIENPVLVEFEDQNDRWYVCPDSALCYCNDSNWTHRDDVFPYIESYGLKISQNRSPGNIVAVSALESIFEKYGYQVLNRTLRLCIGAWEGDVNSFSANIMNAIAKMVAVYGDSLNDAVFKEKVGAASIKALTRTAKERRPGFMGYAEAMVLEYNGKKRNNSQHRLRLNLLYAKEPSAQSLFDDDEDEYEDDDIFEEEV